MPGVAAPGRADSLTQTQHLRFLSCEVAITTNVPEFMQRLAYMAQRAEQDVPLTERCAISVTLTGGEYRIVGDDGGGDGDDGGDDAELNLNAALDTVFRRIHRRALACMPDHIRVHAASGLHPSGAFLIVGPKHAGKTTLALRLLLDGFTITGDELVLLQDGLATAFPRKFYVREGGLDLLPAAKALRSSAPFVSNPTEGRLTAVDPTDFGRPWRIAPSKVAAIIWIEPNHGGSTRMIPCRKVEMVQRVLPECTPPESGRTTWVNDLCQTVEQAESVILRLGDLDNAALALRKLLG